MSKEHKSGSGLYAVEPGGYGQLNAERAMIVNAAAYIENLSKADEEIRLPDGQLATTFIKRRWAVSAFLTTDSVNSQRWGLLVLQPSLRDTVGQMTGLASGAPTVTWSDDPNYTSLTSDFGYYRVTSLSTRFENTGALLNRGCTIYAGLAPETVLTAVGSPAWVGTLSGSVVTNQWRAWPNMTTASSTERSSFDLSWLPGDLVGGPLENGLSGTGGIFSRGNGIRTSTNPPDLVMDTCLFFIMVGTADSSDKFTVQIDICYEFVPKTDQFWLFHPRFALGSAHAIELVWAEILLAHSGLEFHDHIARMKAIAILAREIRMHATGGGSFFGKIKKFAKGAFNKVKKLVVNKAHDFIENPLQTLIDGGAMLASNGLMARRHKECDAALRCRRIIESELPSESEVARLATQHVPSRTDFGEDYVPVSRPIKARH